MTTPAKHSVRVQVGGEELPLRTELPPEYAREVAAHFDDALRRIRAASPSLEAYKAAILAGLAVTDELFRSRRGDAEVGRADHGPDRRNCPAAAADQAGDKADVTATDQQSGAASGAGGEHR